MTSVAAYVHGIYPRSEAVVEATRDLDRGRTTPERVEERYREDEEDFLRLQQEADLDYLSDGLLRWQDVFRPLVEASPGLEADGLIRWFDNNSFIRTPVVSGPVALDGRLPAVIPQEGAAAWVGTLPSPYLFSRVVRGAEDRTGLMRDLAREVLRPVADALVGRGCRLVHLEEPWLVYAGMDQAEWPAFEECLALIGDGLGAPVHLHTYFGDAAPWADRLRALPVDAVGIDLVETDLGSLGGGWGIGVVAGCLDGRSSLVESAGATVEAGRRLAEALEPPALFISTTCDPELLPREVADRKVQRLGETVARLREVL